MDYSIKQRFTETNEYLGNPHKGCCTFQHFNKDPLFPGRFWSEEGPTEFPSLNEADLPFNDKRMLSGLSYTEGYLPSTVSYCRWFWEIFEATEGEYDFSIIEQAMDVAKSRGQTVAVRLMAYGSGFQPQVPQWYSDQYPCETKIVRNAKHCASDPGSREIKVPIHDSPEYFKKWGDAIRAFAKIYDGDPRLESIDVAYIGPWGEGDGEISLEQCQKFAALWAESFQETPVIGQVDGIQLKESIKLGSGWRCDCFGDMKAPGSPHVEKHLSWNHHYDLMPSQICLAGAQQSWQHAPVHFESCGVPMDWFLNNYDIDFILEQGLKFHGTYFMPKYTKLPEPWMDKFAEFCKKLGYRYVYRQSNVETNVKANSNMHLESWIENIGVAPIYHRHDFAIRFRQNGQEEIVRLKDHDIRTWLPGDVWLNEDIPLPACIKAGPCDVSAAIIDTDDKVHIKFAVVEQYSDYWVPLATIHVT